jgi:hypothetical protein
MVQVNQSMDVGKGYTEGVGGVTGSQLHHKSQGLSSLAAQSQHKTVAGKTAVQ